MGKFDGILIATDLDGTLVNTLGTVSKENSDAIRYFQSEGGLFTVSTGRYPEYVESNFFGFFRPNAPLICLNGNIIYNTDTKEKIRVFTMEKSHVAKVLEYICETYSSCVDFINVCDEDESYHYKGIVQNDPCKCVAVIKDEESALKIRDDLKERFNGTFTVERSWNVGVEIYSNITGKGKGVEYIKTNLFPHIKKVICVGDYENDVSMINFADVGCAVKNAVPELKAVSDMVLPKDNDSHPIEWIVSSLEEGNFFDKD